MTFKTKLTIVAILLFSSLSVPAQDGQPSTRSAHRTDPGGKVVVVTGARFTYKLIEKWIDDYQKISPGVQIVVESRGSSDPLNYDILAEVYPHEDAIRKTREYIHVGRYAILPVATANSSFARIYADKGLNEELINQIYFHDIFVDQENLKPIRIPCNVYTRLQKAGVPAVFAKYFGHEQKDIKGTLIAGADAHLLKALLRDSAGVTYLPLPLIYDEQTRNTINGLTVLPVDLNDNKKVTDEEKFYDNLDTVIERLESLESNDVNNISFEYLHLSVTRENPGPQVINFLKWVNENGQDDLHHFGYLKPEPHRFEKDKFNDFALKHGK